MEKIWFGGVRGHCQPLIQSFVPESTMAATIFLHYENSGEKLPSITFNSMM